MATVSDLCKLAAEHELLELRPPLDDCSHRWTPKLAAAMVTAGRLPLQGLAAAAATTGQLRPTATALDYSAFWR